MTLVRSLLVALGLVAASIVSECVCAGPVVLVEEGKPRATVVVPDAASPAVRRAAEEVIAYLERMSGARVPVVGERDAGDGVRIDVGLTELVRGRVPEGFSDDPERVWIETHDRGVAVCGGGERGTLFGAYRLLEMLGCRWLTADAADEIVPRRKTVTVEPLRVDTRPAFTWRLFEAGSERWGLTLGLNGVYTAESARTNGDCFHWPRQVRGVHAYHQIVPAAKYAAAHPEWNPLVGGKRLPTELFCQLCLTAPGLADEFAANVTAALDADPGAPAISISPNDGYRWCECETCLALDRKLCGGRTTSQGLDRDRPFVGDRVFWFANEVARRVAEKHADKKLLVLAYVNYAEPPDTIRPEPNVVPFLCHYAPADYSRPIADPSSAANREFDALLHRWLEISPDLMIYSYVSKSMWWRLPRPVLHTLSADVKHLHRLGVRRYYCQSRLEDWPLDGPLYYVLAKLLWDPALDPDALAREWIEGMFGPAAPAMHDHYAAVERSVTTTGRSYSDSPRTQVAGLYDRPCLEQALAALERAERAAASDAAVARRVAAVARTFRYGLAMIDWLEELARIEATGDWSRLADAEAMGRRAMTFGVPPEGVVPGLGVFNRGFGREETKEGRACWNADETGPGDKASGYAEVFIPGADPERPLLVELDVWGESDLAAIQIETTAGGWKRIAPEQPLSRQPQWDRLRFRILPELLAADRTTQRLGLGGGDSQVWIAAIRVSSGEPTQDDASALD